MKFSRLLKGAALTGGILFAVKGLDDRLETTHYIIESDKIPEGFDGFRIVQVSDLHASVVPGITEEIRGETPDIIVMTGDLVHDRGSYDPGILLSERLMQIAPVYNVTGNHDLYRTDYTKYQNELDNTGVITLHDQSVTIMRNASEITLSGIEDPFSEDGNTIEQNIRTSIKTLPETDNYHILLFHRANHMDLLKNNGFDLVLSGHMHGGQIRLPNGRGVCAPKSSWGSDSPLLFPKYFGGHYRYKNMDMIVNRGIGNPMIVPRLFNRPELTVIILKYKRREKQL
ncbi:MAG: metallophosphoesterase [Oscillospiraceae bacterium]|nr:metallophosphoesterase [Oscillospiraceae bacterium]